MVDLEHKPNIGANSLVFPLTDAIDPINYPECYSAKDMEILYALIAQIECVPQKPGKVLMAIQKLKEHQDERYEVLARFPQSINAPENLQGRKNRPIYIHFIPETTCGMLAAADLLNSNQSNIIEMEHLPLPDLIESLNISGNLASYTGNNPGNFLMAGMLSVFTNETRVEYIS